MLRDTVESSDVFNKYFNQAFVVMQYFGYLRRDPNALYLNWIQCWIRLATFRVMVSGFVNALEYRQRFGSEIYAERSERGAVASGSYIADCRLPIADWFLADRSIGNR